MNSLSIHIYPSTFQNESRILKIIHTLKKSETFERVIVIALWKYGLPKHEVLIKGLEVIRIPPLFGNEVKGVGGRILRVVGWHIGVIREVWSLKIDCISSHSWHVLPLSFILKFWKKCFLIYEPHELETETVGLVGWLKMVARFTERLLIHKAESVCVVNQSIADWYSKNYNLNYVWVVHNVPYRMESLPERTGLLRSAIGLPCDDNQLLFIYQGLLTKGRGIENLIEVFVTLDSSRHLVFMGYGDLEQFVKSIANDYQNIHYIPAVAPNLIKNYTVDADVGLCVADKICLSYYYGAPNKMFEYAACGVASIVSDFPELSRFVVGEDCGWAINPDKIELKNLILNLDEDELLIKRSNAIRAGFNYCWENEERKLLLMYKHVFENK